jgi:O-antigen ligase
MSVLSSYRKNLTATFNRWKMPLLKMAIIAGVLVLSAGIAYKATRTQALFVLAAVIGLGGAIILLQWPSLILFAILFTGFFLHFELANGLNVAVVMVLGLIGLWGAKMFVVDRKFYLVPSRTNAPIFTFIVISLISFGIGMLPLVPFSTPAELSAQAGGMAIFILSALTFLAVANFIEERWLEWFMWAFIIVGALYMVGRIVSWRGIHTGRPFASGATTNSMFWTWLVATVFGQFYLNKRLHWGIRTALGFLLLLTFFVAYVLSNDWKSGWVPPAVVIVAILGLRYWKFSLFMAPIGAVAAIVIAGILISTDEYSWGTRLDAWMIVIEIAKASPLFGLGFANYFWYSRFFPIRGWFVPFNSHSQYVDLIAQTGILGLLGFLWIFWEVGRLGWDLREKVDIGFERGYVYGILGGIAGTLVASALADWVLPFAYNIGLSGFRSSILAWIFMGGLVVIEQRVRNLPASQTQKEQTT